MKSRGISCLLAFLSFCATKSWAEPYLAAWKGVNCNSCHVNQTGGWIRNDFGKNYGNSLETFQWEEISEAADTLKHNTPSWISFGLDMHESYTATFNPNPNSNQSSFYQSPFTQYIPGREAFSLQARANEIVSGVFTYRLDEQAVKEAYGLVTALSGAAYLKLGKFMMPYGLTLADDNSLVREALLPAGSSFSFDYVPNDGIEAGAYPDPFFLNAAIANGTSNIPLTTPVGYNEKFISAKGGFCISQITLGGSVYGENLDLDTRRLRYGTYGWGRIGPVVILGEYDKGYDGLVKFPDATLPGPVTLQNNYEAYHVSAEFDLGNSVYLRLTNEWLNDSMGQDTSDGYRTVVSV